MNPNDINDRVALIVGRLTIRVEALAVENERLRRELDDLRGGQQQRDTDH